MTIVQFFLQYFIVVPALVQYNIEPTLSFFFFSLLVFATLLLGAGGYIINDILDTAIDKINKPTEMIIERLIPRELAYKLYFSLTIIGVLIGVFLAYKVVSYRLMILHPFIAGLLYFYSKDYKRRFLSGNLVVAFLGILLVATVPFFEVEVFRNIPIHKKYGYAAELILIICCAYGGFSAITTLMREIIKDVEDSIGDRIMGAKTLAVKWGVSPTKNLLFGLNIVLLVTLVFAYFQFNFVLNWYCKSYILVFLFIPVLYLFRLIYKAFTKSDFSKLSNYLKLYMVFGILFLPIFFLTQLKDYL